MGKNNSLPPASQPWVRELEARLKALESGVSRVKRSPASAPTRHIDTDNLRVQSLTVGGSDPVVEVLQTGVADMGWSKVVGADRVTFTAPVPVLDREPPFVLEWSIVASASKDYIQFHSSLHDDPYTPPTDPSGSLAGEEAEYFAVYNYVNDDPTDELYKPIPTSVTVTFIDPNGGPVDVTMVESTLKLITPGSGGLQIGSDGGISIVDGVGNETTIREISPEEAQGIKDSTEWINTSGEELREGVSDAQGKLTNLISNVLPQLNADLEANKNQITETKNDLEVAFPSGNYFDVDTALTDAKDKAITSTVPEYAQSSSDKFPPLSGWGTTPPERVAGAFMWTRSRITYGSGREELTEPVLVTGNDGKPAVLLRIDSTRGTAFKNNEIATVLTVTIFHGDQQINDIEALHARIGSGAYLEWWWRRMDDTDFGIISSADPRLGNAGFTLTVSPDDVDQQTVFQCILHS